MANVDGTWMEVPEGLPPSIWAARRCADFIQSRAGSPWFAQYCPTIPHAPYTPTLHSEHLYNGEGWSAPSVNERNMSDKLGWMRQLPRPDAASLQEEFEGKKEELADLDYGGILPILKALEDAGEFDSTMIFFTSDNGYLRGEHRLHAKDHPYGESSMVPFLVKGPGVRRGARRNAFVNHTDLMPTTCEIAGISSASLDVDGRSMLPHLGAAAYSGWRKRMLVTGSDDVGPEMNPGGADYPSGRWWLLRENEKAFILHENGEKELYWMNEDPHQKRNGVEQAAPALIERMTNTTQAMKAAAGETRRKLEEA